MFITTETGHIVNSDYIKNISWIELKTLDSSDRNRILVKACGVNGEEYYLTRCETIAYAMVWIESIQEQING